MSNGTANRLAVETWWAALVDEGLRNVVVCPGSRSSVLAIGAARNAALAKHVCIDERSAAFFALGIAKATERPVAIVCTSGTAAANFLPAVCEAHHSAVPLILVTADRPPELQQSGAPQTMRQTGLFGRFAAADFDLPAPGPGVTEPKTFAAFAKRAYQASWNLRGPVHVNFPFREPLLPEPSAWPPVTARLRSIPDNVPPSSVQRISPLLQAKLRKARNPILIAGPQTASESERRPILRWATSWGVTVFADIASGLRFGEPMDNDPRLRYYEAFLAAGEASSGEPPLPTPDLVIQTGAAPVSKRLATWVASLSAEKICIHPSGAIDASNRFDRLLPGRLADYVDAQKPVTAGQGCELWAPLFETARRLAPERTKRLHPEQALAAGLRRSLPENSLLFLSSSMPIRDFDGFFWRDGEIAAYANRGVNGIDGVVSTALGTAAGAGKRFTAVVGDVAFLHDANALTMLGDAKVSGVILLIDNAGGRIFGELPVGNYPEYERYFATPPRVDLPTLAQAYGVNTVQMDSVTWTIQAVEEAHASYGLTLVCFKVPATETMPRGAAWQRLMVQPVSEAEAV